MLNRLFKRFGTLISTNNNLSIQYQVISVIGSFLCIISIVLFATHSTFLMAANSPILLASMGASVVILLFAPSSSFASYWSFLGGHVTSAFIGITCAKYLPHFPLASALAVSGSISIMLLLRCLHPPGAATALVPVINYPSLTDLGYQFVLTPVLFNVVGILLMVTIINRYLLRYKSIDNHFIKTPTLSQQDVKYALTKEDEFIDVNINKLHELLINAELHKFKRLHGDITCGDIMRKSVTTVQYGDEVEIAWQKIHIQKLKAIPVLDKANHVIGIVTLADFLQFVEMSPYVSFQQKLASFIRRTPDITTQKPEVVGHIMSKQVVVLSEKSAITHLIALFSKQGHAQIPIINADKKLVGMVYQSDLIKVLNDKIVLKNTTE